MRKLNLLLLISLVCIISSCKSKNNSDVMNNRVVVGYYSSWTEEIPDIDLLTHINYAFGHVSETFDGVLIDNCERLEKLVKLRSPSSNLKILLAIGGWGSGGFSEMARSKECRSSFANACKQIIDTLNLDGIDLDWEYPTIGTAGIEYHQSDTENFTLLVKDIRKAIGKDKLLTIASSSGAKFIDFPSIVDKIDFVNIMGYDYSVPPCHHSALYSSELSAKRTSEFAVEAHLQAGIPADKLVLGIPFYGLADTNKEMPYSIGYKEINNHPLLVDCKPLWDDEAKVPYYVDDKGELILSFENAKSIAWKCEYIISKGLRGGMYWQFSQDDENLTLSHTIYNQLLGNPELNRN